MKTAQAMAGDATGDQAQPDRSRVEVRDLAPHEYQAAFSLFDVAMHEPPGAGPGDPALVIDPACMFGAFIDGCLVGMCQGLPTSVTVPGGTRLPARIMNRFAVRPGCARQGAGTALMKAFLARAAEPLVMLRASEGGIYQHFGFGVATRAQDLLLDCHRASFAEGVQVSGSVRVIPLQAAISAVQELYRLAPRRPGMVERPGYFDRLYEADAASGGLLVAIHSEAGGDDGFALYFARRRAGDDSPATVILDVVDMQCRTPAAWRSLWAFLAGVDLAHQVLLRGRPLDEPAPWIFSDPRACTVSQVRDEAWLRLNDAPAALASRSYGHGDAVVIDVRDRLLPSNQGRYEVGRHGATRTEQPAQLSMDVDALAALYLGCVRPSALAAAGRVAVVGAAAALESADQLFAVPDAPWCGTTI